VGAIDLRKALHFSTFRRPFDFECVASNGLDVEVAFNGKRNYPFAAAALSVQL
jgi:hypothetical protein